MRLPFTVYFELFGKKMKTAVLADDENDARQKVVNKIIWHKTTMGCNEDSAVNILEDLFDMTKT